METVIDVEDVTKIYRIYENTQDRFKESVFKDKNYHRDYFALDHISFRVKKGEILGIIGRNGSGKSTVLKILAGVLSPSSGTVTMTGKTAALLELGAGFNMEYTGMKNIYLNATMMHISHSEIEKKIPDILKFADIGDYVNQPVKTYSSGMFVRLAFAVAINVDPDILIVDEALAVGDSRFQMKCMDKFTEFVQRGKTILFVTHDINSVKRFCTRTIWLDQGKIIMDGDTDEVTDRYNDFIISNLSFAEYLNGISKIDEARAQEYVGNDCDEESLKGIDIVKINGLKMIDSTGSEISNIKFGEKVILKASYIVADDTIEAPLLGIAVRSIDNEYICGLNTKLDNEKIPWKRGYNEITLIYDRFNLTGGEYYFDVGIFDRTGIVNLDYSTKIKTFFVEMDYIAEGIVVLEHRWRTGVKNDE